MKAIVAIAVALLALGPVQSKAQNTPSAPPPRVWSNKADCDKDLESGHYIVYEASDLKNYGREPVDSSQNRVFYQLPATECMQMQTVLGDKYVVQERGTLFRAYLNPTTGAHKIYALDKCGNGTPNQDWRTPPAPALVADGPKLLKLYPDTLVHKWANALEVNVHSDPLQVKLSGSIDLGWEKNTTIPTIGGKKGGTPWGWIALGAAAVGSPPTSSATTVTTRAALPAPSVVATLDRHSGSPTTEEVIRSEFGERQHVLPYLPKL